LDNIGTLACFRMHVQIRWIFRRNKEQKINGADFFYLGKKGYIPQDFPQRLFALKSEKLHCILSLILYLRILYVVSDSLVPDSHKNIIIYPVKLCMQSLRGVVHGESDSAVYSLQHRRVNNIRSDLQVGTPRKNRLSIRVCGDFEATLPPPPRAGWYMYIYSRACGSAYV
jgi:hypothetical protein